MSQPPRPKAKRSEGDSPKFFESPTFLDGKEADALRTIGEVSAALGIRQHVLRYWEEQFPMLRPVKRSGARRYYRPADVQLLMTIDRLVYREGYTLRGARAAIEAGDVVPPLPPEPDLIAALQKIRTDLARALVDGSPTSGSSYATGGITDDT